MIHMIQELFGQTLRTMRTRILKVRRRVESEAPDCSGAFALERHIRPSKECQYLRRFSDQRRSRCRDQRCFGHGFAACGLTKESRCTPEKMTRRPAIQLVTGSTARAYSYALIPDASQWRNISFHRQANIVSSFRYRGRLPSHLCRLSRNGKTSYRGLVVCLIVGHQ
jgi:hypothetical protein